MHFKKSICSLALVLGAACSQQSDNQSTADAADKSSQNTGGAQNLGSSTDITTNSVAREQSDLNKADNGIGGPVQRETGNFERQPLPAAESDQELAKAVRVALSTGSTGTTGVIAEDQLTKIQVTSHDGVVTLTGPVQHEQEKKIIEKQVSGMKGVKSVVNNLEISPSRKSDTPLQPLFPRTPGNE